MSEPVAAESQQIAHELYGLLRALDRTPADDLRAELRDRAERLSGRVRAVIDRAADVEHRAAATVVTRLREVAGHVDELQERMSKDAAPRSAFATFRARAAPAYEALAASLRDLERPVPTLRPLNYARSIMHVTSGLLAVLAIELLPSWSMVVAIAAGLFVFAWTMEIGRRRVPGWNRFAMWLFRKVVHPHERDRVNSSTWYTTALFALALLASPLASALACIVLGVGDPAAGLVGRRFGRHRLFAGRSLEGTLAFFAAGTLAAFGVLAVFHGSLPLSFTLAASLAAGASGALTELVSRTVDDNLTIPLVVAAAVTAVMAAFGVA